MAKFVKCMSCKHMKTTRVLDHISKRRVVFICLLTVRFETPFSYILFFSLIVYTLINDYLNHVFLVSVIITQESTLHNLDRITRSKNKCPNCVKFSCYFAVKRVPSCYATKHYLCYPSYHLGTSPK